MILTHCRLRPHWAIWARNAVAATPAIVGLNARCSTGKGATIISAKNKKAGGAEQYNANKMRRPSRCCGGMYETPRGRRAHLHLPSTENEGGPRARVFVPRDGGFAHVSCLAEQAKILVGRPRRTIWAETRNERFARWFACSLCEQQYLRRVLFAGRAGRRRGGRRGTRFGSPP